MTDYEKYQLQWMIDHGYSLSALMRELQDLQYSDPEDGDRISTPITELFEEWENDVGFGSEVWACEEEWKTAEGRPEEAAPSDVRFFEIDLGHYHSSQPSCFCIKGVCKRDVEEAADAAVGKVYSISEEKAKEVYDLDNKVDWSVFGLRADKKEE